MRSVMNKETIAFSKKPKKVPKSLLIGSLPNKVTYKVGETLNLSGLTMVVRYSDDTVKDITDEIATEPVDGSVLYPSGTVNLLISYTENNITVTTSLPITIETKIVTWSEGTDEEIIAMVDAADRGVIDLTEYWNVGQERKITLGAMEMYPNEYYEPHESETITFVLMNKGGKELVNPTTSGRTECSFVVGQKEVLTKTGPMENYVYGRNGWESSGRRAWCNEMYYNAIPSGIRPIFKLHKNYNRTIDNIVEDYFALPSVEEISNESIVGSVTPNQFKWYEIDANKIKYYPNGTKCPIYWSRSYYPDSSYCCFYRIHYGDDSVSYDYADYLPYYSYGLSPFGVI